MSKKKADLNHSIASVCALAVGVVMWQWTWELASGLQHRWYQLLLMMAPAVSVPISYFMVRAVSRRYLNTVKPSTEDGATCTPPDEIPQ